jgi:MscS family membrane protein
MDCYKHACGIIGMRKSKEFERDTRTVRLAWQGSTAGGTLICDWEKYRQFSLLQKRAGRLRTGAYLLSFGFLLCLPARAQLGAPATASVPAPTTVQPETPKDSLGRTTPRGTVLGFLSAARIGNDELAVRYLNTRLRGKAAAVLAHQLFTVLDRRLPPKLTQLSDKPEGSLSDPLRPDQDLIGTISSGSGNVDIFVEQVDRGTSGPVWLFSSKTLDSIPDLYDEINVVSADTILPEFLVNTRFVGIPLFEWLAFFVGMPLFYFLTVLLNRLLSSLIGLLRRRLYKKPDLPSPEFLPGPVRLLLLAFVIHWLITKISLPLLARQLWTSTASIIIIAACVWLLVLFNGWAEEYLHRLFRSRHISGTTSLLRLARRLADLLVIFAGLLAALYYIGVNPTAELAGIGVGGIAVALAAQKTLENVIGGISLIFDGAMRVGDTVKIGDTQGTVDDIGLRSTRIRTSDRTMVSVPNGQIASMRLEDISSRDKFWFHPVLALRYGTTSTQVQTVLDRIRNLLKENRYVETDSVRVRFLRFGPSSLDVEVSAYVLGGDWNHFLEVQEGLLLRILESVESTGVQFAQQFQAVLSNASNPEEAVGRPYVQPPSPVKKTSEDAVVVKSA